MLLLLIHKYIICSLSFLCTGSSSLLLQVPHILNEDSSYKTVISCRKDTGGHKKIRNWSRGYQFIVSGGGHIEMFAPLYQ